MMKIKYYKKYNSKHHIVIESDNFTYFVELMPLVHCEIHYTNNLIFGFHKLGCNNREYPYLMRIINEYIDEKGSKL